MKKTPVGLWSALALLALWVCFHFRILVEGRNFVYMDASCFFYPLWSWGAAVWNGGHIPLWNPEEAFGFPYFTDPEMLCWYPPKILFYHLFSEGTAFKFLDLFHYLWFLAGFWILARKKGFGEWPVWIGSLVVGFSFVMVALSTWAQALFFTAAWIPWVFLAAGMAWEGRRGSLLFFSLCSGLQLSAGYPVYAYLTLFGVFAEKAIESSFQWVQTRKFFWRGIWGLGAGTGLAVLYNMAWILPFLEFSPLSNIGRRLELSANLRVANLGTWLNPFFCGHPFFDHDSTPYSFTVYFMGLPVVCLILWGLAKRRLGGPLVFSFFAFLVLSLGKTAEVGDWLKLFVPGYAWVARSGYWMPVLCFFASRLVLEAVQAFLDNKGNKRMDWTWLIISLATVLAALALGVPYDLFSFWICVFCLLALGFMGISSFSRGCLLTGAVFFSLAPVALNLHFTLPQSYYEDKPPMAIALEGPGRLFETPEFVDEKRAISGRDMKEVYEKFKQTLVPNWPLQFGIEQTSFNNTIFLTEFLRWYFAPMEADASTRMKFIDYLGARYIAGSGEYPGAQKMNVTPLAPVWRNPNAFPKWFSVSKALPQGDWAMDFQAMKGPGFDFGRDCFALDPAASGFYTKREVRSVGITVDRVELEAPGDGRALLVSSELAYPGWKARVEGKERPLEVVNHSFRGLVLEKGESHAVLDYSPSSFRLGMFLSLLTVLVWTWLLFGFFVSGGFQHGRSRV